MCLWLVAMEAQGDAAQKTSSEPVERTSVVLVCSEVIYLPTGGWGDRSRFMGVGRGSDDSLQARMKVDA